jgi:protein-disulfide isomerase
MEEFQTPTRAPEHTTPKPQSEGASSPYLIPAAIVVAGALIAGAVAYGLGGGGRSVQPPPQGGEDSTPPAADISQIADDDPVLGNPGAEVTIVEFGDFQCPFCSRLASDTLPRLKAQYVDTGKARFIWRDFPIRSIHEFAQKAAEAGECVDEQGKFWQYHDILIARQAQLNFSNLRIWAAELGVDVQKFNQCLDSGKYAAEVAKDLADGQALGVTGTPATFVNGRLISGAVPYAQFAALIEEELKKVK